MTLPRTPDELRIESIEFDCDVHDVVSADDARWLLDELRAARKAVSSAAPSSSVSADEIERLTKEVAALETDLEKEQTALDAVDAALTATGISGIFDTFTGPADAIRQMAQHIRELEAVQSDTPTDTERLDWLNDSGGNVIGFARGYRDSNDAWTAKLTDQGGSMVVTPFAAIRQAIDAALSASRSSGEAP